MDRLVVDASLVTGALVGTGHTGAWALDLLEADHVLAPSLLPVEVANVLRRLALSGAISDDNATLAHAQLLALPIDYHGYEDLGSRVWALRGNVRPYDAWYVALAERFDAPLGTMDFRLSQATGPVCTFLTPGVR
jgi:predicted nucleic acid-binding protein